MATRKLATYRSKRDFTSTAEPSGELAVAPSPRLRFVIQKHAARRLHYDLRLELDGVFKSWAVTKGPSPDPKVKRLAVAVEDHPLDYGDFEGTIPKGQYGGGSVLLWDRGYWEPEGSRSADAMLRNGSLRFKLEGERLQGGWILVRMRNDRSNERRQNWLLIKHHDAFERADKGDAPSDEDRSVASGRTMAEIAAGKGRRPRPFMLEGGARYRSDAVWNSNRSEAAESVAAAASLPRRIKSQCRAGHEVVIGGWTESSGRLRSLLVGAHRGSGLCYLGAVARGFAGGALRGLRAQLSGQESKRSPFVGANAPAPRRGLHWAKPTLVAEVEFIGRMKDGLVRAAAFKGLREDRSAAEVKVERAAKVATPKLGAPLRRSTSGARGSDGRHSKADKSDPPVVMGVTISSPDKPLWPATKGSEAITKLELARYYEVVGPSMMAHIRGRPCSIIRAPDGIGGERFFQRHAMLGTSSLIQLVKISGDRKPYLQIDRIEALAALAQVAALELHPWNCVPGDPELPGRFVFDLDPAPDVEFARVIEAASELRARLEKLGLVGFCKTTGGKGLHVVAPFSLARSARIGWPEAKALAREICVRMAADSPTKYVMTMAKKERAGRIFLDYLRNDRMATAVAPLSPRARAGAPVSMPLDWAQVKKGLDPMRYTVRSVPSLLARSPGWRDYSRCERPLLEALKRVKRITSGSKAA